MALEHPPPFDGHVMMDWVPTSVHFDLTQCQSVCYIRGPVEVDEPSFHSPTLDSLSQAAWVIVDDGTPEEKRHREKRYSSLVKVGIRDQMPVAGVYPGVLWQGTGGVLLFS